MIIKGIEIDPQGNITLSIVTNEGLRTTLDFTAHIDARAKDAAAEAVADHMRKWHGHSL